jgi:trk system potassium uptake protein
MKNIIIVSCGRLGIMLSTMLSLEGYNITVIDNDPEKFRNLPNDFNGNLVKGAGYDVNTLHAAQAGSADLVVTLSEDDNINIMIAQAATTIFRVPRVIARVFEPRKAETYRALGMEIVCTTTELAGLFHDRIIRNDTALPDAINNSDIHFIEKDIEKDSSGTTTEEYEKYNFCRVIYVIRDEMKIFPRHNFQLAESDRILTAVWRKQQSGESTL